MAGLLRLPRPGYMPAISVPIVADPANWLLATGAWADSGEWVDAETWNDGA